VLAGLAIVVLALLLLTGAGESASYFPGLFGGYALMGLGIGTAMLPLLTIAMSGVPEADAGLASGIVNVSMQLAGALGIAILGTLASDRAESLAGAGATRTEALTGGYHLALEVAAFSVAVGIAIALLVLRTPRKRDPRSELAVEVG
jgi:MFS family permease